MVGVGVCCRIRHSISISMAAAASSPSSHFLFAHKCLRISRALLLLSPTPPSPLHLLRPPLPLCLSTASLSSSSHSPRPHPKTAHAARNAREEIRRLDDEVRRLQKERKLVGKGRDSASSLKTKGDGGSGRKNTVDVAARKNIGRKSDSLITSRNAGNNPRSNRARAAASYEEEDEDVDDESDEDEMDEEEDDEDDIDEELEELGEDFSSDAEMFMETTDGEETGEDESQETDSPAPKTTQLPDRDSGTAIQGQSPSGNTNESGSTSDKPSDELEHVKHPWKEWNTFFDVLKQSNYFKDVPDLNSAIAGNGYLRFQSSPYMKHAILEFSRERDDIIRFLTTKHIRTVVNVGCPVTDRKVVNASKRLRVLCEVPEDEVCQQCKLKTFCTRAFAAPSPDLKAETVDLTRVLYAFALNASPIAESQVSYPITVIKSACHLLDEIVQVSAYPKDPRAPVPKSRLPVKPAVVENAETDSRNPNRRPGDWTCPDCNFLNFSKNHECRECGTFREAANPLEPGDWECPKCTFVNFRRNKECRECLTPRPQGIDVVSNEKMMPGDWKCPECQFLNFRKNNDCRKCSARRPLITETHEIEELEPGDWKCPGCSFINFKKNKQCKECGSLCPEQNRSDERWGLKKASTVSRQGWGSTKPVSSSLSDAVSARSRNKFQEWKPDLGRKMPNDSDDDLEEDADVVFQHNIDDEDDDALPRSFKSPQRTTRTKSRQRNDDTESTSDFDFSDLDDKPTKKTNRKPGKQSHNAQNRKIIIEEDEDDDNDMENELGYFEDDLTDDEPSYKPASKQKPIKGRGFKDWSDDDEDDNDDDNFGKGKSRGSLGRAGRNSRGRGRGNYKSSEGSDDEVYSRGSGAGRGGRGGMRGRGGGGGGRRRGGMMRGRGGGGRGGRGRGGRGGRGGR